MTIDPFHRRIALIGLVVVGLVAGCNLPVDERVTPLDQRALPDDLTEPTTTTTTTTTTTVPPTTVPDVPVDSAETTTTAEPAIQRERITVYYTRGLTDVMQPVVYSLPESTPVDDLIMLLERPTDEIGELRTSLLPGLIDDISPVERATATVTLDQAVLDRMSEPNRQRAIAQIVLTLTSFATTGAGNIGLVRFEVDGEGLPVYAPGLGGQSEPGEPLAFDDFSSLIVTSTPSTTTTTPPTTPPTTPATAATNAPDPPGDDDGGDDAGGGGDDGGGGDEGQ